MMVPAMPLSALVADLPGARYGAGSLPAAEAARTRITGIAYDSRKVRPGDLFVALKGTSTDGHRFVQAAVEAGAAALLVESAPFPAPRLPVVVVEDTRLALAHVAVRFFRQPSRDLSLIGVTGTNGKTTLTYLVEGMVAAAGGLPGVIGTVEQRYLEWRQTSPPNTTPESLDLQALLRRMADAGVTHVALEVSSHGLSTHRTLGCEFAVRVFTNLTRDHLDFHGDMESYYQAKALLFREYRSKSSVVNLGTPYGRRLFEELKEGGCEGTLIGYSVEEHPDAAVRVLGEAEVGPQGIEAVVETPAGRLPLRSRLLGGFNLENLVAAVAVGTALGFPLDAIGEGIGSVGRVPGRMEPVPGSGGHWPLVLVDYAHTPDALERALVAARESCRGNVILVFGCGGDRDRGKRPEMGRVAARMADRVILTSDNPRSEEPLRIIADIAAGFGPGDGPVDVVVDRREAIELAVGIARPEDVVLVAGKGHERTQKTGDRVEPFSDLDVGSAALAARALREAFSRASLRISGGIPKGEMDS